MQASPKRDLEWFFDDWVYRDRGLPEFHVESAYTRPLLSEANKSFLVTATIENRGGAGAEVPVLIQTPSGEKSVRVVVKAGEKGRAASRCRSRPTKLLSTTGVFRRPTWVTTCMRFRPNSEFRTEKNINRGSTRIHADCFSLSILRKKVRRSKVAVLLQISQ